MVTHKQYGKQAFMGAYIKNLETTNQKTEELEITELKYSSGVLPKYAVVPVSTEIHDESTAQNLDFAFPEKCIVYDVFVDVTTAEATSANTQISVGRTNNDNGFLNSVEVGSLGIVKGSLADGVGTLGDLLYVDRGGTGETVPEPDVSSGEDTLRVQAEDGQFDDFEGNIIVVYTEIE